MPNDLAARYRRFAEVEAQGRSPLYEMLALAVADSPALQAFLDTLPEPRRQPNLFFAACRKICGLPSDTRDFEAKVATHGPAIAALMLARTTQTNEPARAAVLAPALAGLPGPLSLIEVGASAGLCLLPDRYGYDWGRGAQIAPDTPEAPVFQCDTTGPAPVPERLPDIAWRRGLDLNPLDLTDPDDTAWLETLVWPEDTDRLDRLRAAIALARRDPPQVVAGDLTQDLAALEASAPAGTTRVIFHTAVLSYVKDRGARAAFAAKMLASDSYWLCNEAPGVFPDIAAKAGPPPAPGLFLMSLNGAPLAWTGPHGQSLHWI